MWVGHSDVVKGVSVATLLGILAALSAPGGIFGSVQAVAAVRAWVRKEARPRRRRHGRHAARGPLRVGSRRGMSMIMGEGGTRWLVRLSVPRRGGMRAWGAVRGAFERNLVGQESAVVGPQIEGETRRGRDYVRVVIVMTVTASDVAEALGLAWQAFRQATGSDAGGWDMAGAAAEVRPETGPSSGSVTAGG